MSLLAIPASPPQQATSGARRNRLLQWIIHAVTGFAVAIAVLAVGVTTVMLAID
jgi:type IV secretory pathway VirB2 component (pilin)